LVGGIYAQKSSFLIKKALFLAKIHKKSPFLPKIAKYGLETNSRFN
jgi:hypothetical protein